MPTTVCRDTLRKKRPILVLIILSKNMPVRFNFPDRMNPDISTKTLADTLIKLDADRLVNRKNLCPL